MNWTYYTNNNYSIVPDDDFYSGCWNINHYYRQQSFSRQFWYYFVNYLYSPTDATQQVLYKLTPFSGVPSPRRLDDTIKPTASNAFWKWRRRTILLGVTSPDCYWLRGRESQTPKKQIGLPLFGRLMLLITQRMITDRIKHAKMTRSSWSIS